MTNRVFISTTGGSLVRACRSESGTFEVQMVLSGVGVRCLAADPLDGQRVYAGTLDGAILRSDDRGRTWKRLHDSAGASAAAGLAGQPVMAISASATQPDVLYAGTRPARLYLSRDAGATWQDLSAFRRIPWRWLWFSPAEKPFIA